jgi:hypothetical protein
MKITGSVLETAKGIYTRLSEDRAPYITRAEQAAEYTIPSLFPKSGSGASTTFKTPYQSLGARGLNNLAAQILLAIMPPNTTFFRLDVTPGAKQKVEAKGVPDVLSQIQYALSQREQTIMKYFDARQFRVSIGEGVKQLLCAGNYLFFLPPKEGGIKGYKLNSYVLERDGLGKVFRIVAKDSLSYASLRPELQAMVDKKGAHKAEDTIEIYTHVYLEDGFYLSYQEVEGEEIPGSDQKYPEDKTPWIPIRMVKVEGENYGRGYIEEIIGDLIALEGLSKAILEYAAIASRIIYLTNPNGQTQPRRVSKAKSGDFVSGRKEDIAALTLDKYNDFQVAKAQVDSLKADLSLAFLLNSAVQRNAERVTAEEIRYVARELENGLGGIYSILSQELQLPLIRCAIAQLQNMKVLEDFPEGAIEPSITTGIEALGRGQDLDKLDQYLRYLVEIPGAVDYMKIGGLLKTIATALSIDAGDLVRTDQEVQQILEQRRQAEMAQNVAPHVAGGLVQAGLKEQQTGGQ